MGPHNELSGSAGTVVQAGHIGSVTFVTPPVVLSVIPYVVPPGPRTFIDRDEHIARVRELAAPRGGGPAVVTVHGLRGMGKSALVRHIAALLAENFPDGVLYAAFGPDGETPSSALGRLLGVLGVPEQAVPTDFKRRCDLYRSMIARKPMIVVLDDVTEAAQVSPLLPAAGLVLIAGNAPLDDLHDTDAIIELDRLPLLDAMKLLSSICPDGRVAADPPAAEELVLLCDRMPHAVRVAGNQLARSRHRTISGLVDELRASPLTDKVYDSAYRELPEKVRALYRTLGVLVGGGFTAELIAAVTARPVPEVTADLDLLCRTGLAENRPDNTYAVPALVRAHALRRSAEEDTDTDRTTMLFRAVDWWLLGATAADVAVTGWDRLRVADPARLVDRVPTAAAGLAWFEREHLSIVAAMRAAADRGWHEPVWQLFEALYAYFDARRPLAPWLRAAEIAVSSATGPAEARCRCLLAKAYLELERYPQARAELDRARELAAGHERLLASTYDFTGNLALREHRYTDALDWFQKALAINRKLGLGRGTAMQTLMVGRALAALNRTDEALPAFAEARELAASVGAESIVAKAFLAAAIGPDADTVLTEAAEFAARTGQSDVAAKVALRRADLARHRGDDAAADRYANEAAAAYERMGSPRAARVLAGLEDTGD